MRHLPEKGIHSHHPSLVTRLSEELLNKLLNNQRQLSEAERLSRELFDKQVAASRPDWAENLGRTIFEQVNVKKDRSSVGIIDTNLGIDHAIALAKEVNVFYWLAGCAAFPSIEDQITGYGFPGIQKVECMTEAMMKPDWVLITDCYFGKDADNLRDEQIPTNGPSALWTNIENNRVFGWKYLKDKLGVGVPEGEVITGIYDALEYADKNASDQTPLFAKINKYRGNGETGGPVKNKTQLLVKLTQAGFGPFLTDIEILFQKPCPGLELGFDAFFNGKVFIRPYLLTIEVKGEGTVGVWVEQSPIDELILDKIADSLRKSRYHGNISFEFFYDGEKVYCHDPTARLPFPCSAIQAHKITNYPEVMEKVARGEEVSVKYDGPPYVAQVGVYTDDIATWRDIQFPKNMEDNIGFRRICKKDGDYYFVPGDYVVATAIGQGRTPKEAIESASNIADNISMPNCSFPAKFEMNALKTIDALNAMKGEMRF